MYVCIYDSLASKMGNGILVDFVVWGELASVRALPTVASSSKILHLYGIRILVLAHEMGTLELLLGSISVGFDYIFKVLTMVSFV